MKDILRPVAMMHVEIGNGYPLQAMVCQGMRCTYRDIVEYAEAARAGLACVMAGRTHIAEGIFRSPRHHKVDRQHNCSGSSQRSFQSMRIHRRIGVETTMPASGAAARIAAI